MLSHSGSFSALIDNLCGVTFYSCFWNLTAPHIWVQNFRWEKRDAGWGMKTVLTSHPCPGSATNMPNWISWLVLESHSVYKITWTQIGRINEEGTNNLSNWFQLHIISTGLCNCFCNCSITLARTFVSVSVFFWLISHYFPVLGGWNVMRLHLSSRHIRSLQRFAAPWGLQSLPPLAVSLAMGVWADSQRKFSSHTSEWRTSVHGQSSHHHVNL